jgi:hypothetical protein
MQKVLSLITPRKTIPMKPFLDASSKNFGLAKKMLLAFLFSMALVILFVAGMFIRTAEKKY